MQYYNVESRDEAMKLWEMEMDGKEVFPKVPVEVPEKEMQSVGVEDQEIPFGYELDDGRYIVKKDEKEIITKIFEFYLLGKTMEKISRELTNKGEEKSWSLNDVREILKDPIYAGYQFHGADVIKARHEAIVKPEIFNKVQERIQRNIRNPKYRQKPLVLGD